MMDESGHNVTMMQYSRYFMKYLLSCRWSPDEK